jgi:hypothetical protein
VGLGVRLTFTSLFFEYSNQKAIVHVTVFDGRPSLRHIDTFSLTVITLTVRVIYMAVFEYQNQVIFNMTAF